MPRSSPHLHAALIRKLETAVEFTKRDLNCLDSLCSKVTNYRTGQYLFRQGEIADNVFIILNGWAQRYKTLPDGQRQTFAYLIPGDLSDIYAPTMGLSDHSVALLTPADVAVIDKDEMLSVIDRYPAIARAFVWSMVVDKSVLREWLINVTRREAYERIAHLFCELYARLDLVGLVADDAFQLPVTQEQLGESTAMSTVHVNRILRRMRVDKLIEIGRKRLRILDVERLRGLAGFDDGYFKFAA